MIEEIISNFNLEGELVSCENYGSGHINDTYLLTMKNASGQSKHILQKINTTIFKDPEGLMQNVVGVTEFLAKKIEEEGGNPDRETLKVYLTNENKPYYRDSDGAFWRMYQFIDQAKSYDLIESEEVFYQSAKAFGDFQRCLSDFPADQLTETIESFHDTKKRFERFKQVVDEDKLGRASQVKEEIDFYLSREPIAHVLGDLQAKGDLPLRVTHNDTKTNNVLIDNESGQAICVVDLDTVMPGLSVNDFGDSIRFGTNTAMEDERDLSKVSCDLNLYEVFTKGFIEALDGQLTDKEIEMLPTGALVMTYECGMRFLTDHLEGDVYFKAHRENHNLDRARTQMKLVQEMEDKWDDIQAILEKYK